MGGNLAHRLGRLSAMDGNLAHELGKLSAIWKTSLTNL